MERVQRRALGASEWLPTCVGPGLAIRLRVLALLRVDNCLGLLLAQQVGPEGQGMYPLGGCGRGGGRWQQRGLVAQK